MKAVIFEVVPRDGAMPGYLDTAAQAQGRHQLFERYRIRTATIERERLFEP